MKALVSVEAGGPESLVFLDVPEPAIGPTDLLVRVKACGINFPDGLIIRDKYQIRPPRPFSPGSEISGVVEKVGPAVTKFAPGEHVLARLGWGGMAEKIAVAQERCLRIDDDMPFEAAAAFIFTYGTAYHALIDRAGLKAGDSVLVLGAAGGVGLATVQIASALGANVTAATSSEERTALAKAHGAVRGIVYPRGPFSPEDSRRLAASMREACGLSGANIIVDPIGGPFAEPALRAIARNGRYLVVGFVAGIPSIPLNLPLLKSSSIIGVEWGSFVRADPVAAERQGDALLAFYRQGKIKPVVSQRLAWANAPLAIAQLEQRATTGKLVVLLD